MKPTAILMASAVVVACTGTDDGLLAPPPTSRGIQLAMNVTLQPGEETTVCKNFPLPVGAFDIARFQHAMTPLSHHLIAYPLALASSEVTPELITRCDENSEVQRMRIGMVYATQSASGDLELPQGIAFTAMGGLALQLELHVVNTSDEPADIAAALNLWKLDGPLTGEAGMLFMYNNLIVVPPHAQASARQRCPIAQDLELLTLTPHMHSRGTRMQVFHATGTERELLLDANSWHADTQILETPVVLAAGDTIDYRCDYDNGSDRYVSDGPSATHDEMCVTGGIYIRRGAERMAFSDELCWGEGIVYEGSRSCTEVDACVAAIDFSRKEVSPAPIQLFDQCRLSACQRGGPAFDAFDSCRWFQCRSSCYVNPTDDSVDGLAFDTTACAGCIRDKCSAQLETCGTATCP